MIALLRVLFSQIKSGFRVIRSGVARTLPKRRPRVLSFELGFASREAMDHFLSDSRNGILLYEAGRVRAWERHIRSSTWINVGVILSQLVVLIFMVPLFYGVVNYACLAFIITTQNLSVQRFAKDRRDVLTALEAHPILDVSFYDQITYRRAKKHD